MSLYEKIMDVIDEELNQRLVSMINEYATIVSKKHGISMELLLKDIPDTFSGTICRGTKHDGKRCTFKGVHDGYCKHHAVQKKRLQQSFVKRTNNHTHGPERFFVRGCPGCELSNELIDLGTIINNE